MRNTEFRIQNSEGIKNIPLILDSEFYYHIINLKSLAMQPAKTFEDLIVWQKAHRFITGVYQYTLRFPGEEIYGLTSQFRRAAVSIAANIAEGFKKRGKKDKARFLNIAQGSLEECRYYLILSRDLKYGDNMSLQMLLEEVSKLLDAYHRSILESPKPIQSTTKF